MSQRRGSKDDPGGRVLGVETTSRQAARILGTIQHASDRLPDECPHCHQPWLLVLPDEAQCLCGLIYYKTQGEMRRPTHPAHSRADWA